jgi:hypothetical protein
MAEPLARVDFDLHDLASVRLEGATPAEVAVVRRQLGPIQAPALLDRDPDVVVRFVDRLATGGRVRLVGLEDAGYTDDAFLILRGKHKSTVRVQIPMDRLGAPCEIICERGLTAVPLLVAILNLALLGKGILPLHAAGFVHEGLGILATGWAKGGKTELLLAFAAQGARYVGDEWVYVDAEGWMYGVPEPIRVWDWHLDDLPAYRARLPRGARWKLRGLAGVSSALGWAAGGRLGRTALGRSARRALPLVDRQRNVQVPPAALFGPEGSLARARADALVFVASHAAPDLRVEAADPADIARRMVYSLQYEYLPLWEAYQKFRFAFPDRANPRLDGLEETQRWLLEQCLSGRPAFALWHPYPAPIGALYDALWPELSNAGVRNTGVRP